MSAATRLVTRDFFHIPTTPRPSKVPAKSSQNAMPSNATENRRPNIRQWHQKWARTSTCLTHISHVDFLVEMVCRIELYRLFHYIWQARTNIASLSFARVRILWHLKMLHSILSAKLHHQVIVQQKKLVRCSSDQANQWKMGFFSRCVLEPSAVTISNVLVSLGTKKVRLAKWIASIFTLRSVSL